MKVWLYELNMKDWSGPSGFAITEIDVKEYPALFKIQDKKVIEGKTKIYCGPTIPKDRMDRLLHRSNCWTRYVYENTQKARNAFFKDVMDDIDHEINKMAEQVEEYDVLLADIVKWKGLKRK